MLPRWHIILGVVFCIIFKIISPQTNYFSLFLIFFASVFIDFDHYLASGINSNKWHPKDSLTHNYNLRQQVLDERKEIGLCKKGDFHLFHTVESHLIISITSLFFAPAFFFFIGMVFHSILDIIWMVRHDVLDSREFFLFNKLRAILS